MKKTSSFFTGFLAMLVAAGLFSSAGTAQAALISINIGSFGIDGINGGVANGAAFTVYNFPISGNELYLYNNSIDGNFTGLRGDVLTFANGGTVTPVKFSLNDSIGSGSTYGVWGLFKFYDFMPANWASGSYMGFRTSQGNYGWLEVTWTASSEQFQILSGAYEDQIDTPILAGAGGPGPAAVPEPGTWAAAALLASGAAFMRWRKRAKVA